MQRVARAGLAGLPGVVLSQHDRRRLASFFRKSGSGLSGVGGAGDRTRADARAGGSACATCAPSTDAGLAALMARHLGAPELAAAALDPNKAPLLQRASLLASATFEVTKFRKDRIAVLSGITSPVFAKLAASSLGQLAKSGKVTPDEAYRSVLVLLFLAGAAETEAGRLSPLANGYRKALKDLREAVGSVSDPALMVKAAALFDGTGLDGSAGAGGSTNASRSPTRTLRLNGFGFVDTGGSMPSMNPASVGYDFTRKDPIAVVTGAEAAFASRSAGGYSIFKSSDPKAFWPPARKKNLTDVGSLVVSPDAVDFVPVTQTAALVFDWLVAPAKAGKGPIVPASAATADPTTPDGAAQRLAAWVIRFHGNTVKTWSTSSGRVAGSPVFSAFTIGAGDVALDSSDPRNFRIWVEWHLEQFLVNATPVARLKEIATAPGTVFPMRVAALLRLASKDCVARTGQVGAYDSVGMWRPGIGAEQVPPGPGSVYATKAGISVPVRRDQLMFGADEYRRVYRKEPTDHAQFWYGSFGYNVQTSTLERTFAARIASLEAVRIAGSVPPPRDQTDQSNVFMQLFQSVGPGLAVTLDWVNQGTKATSDALCGFFKVVFGADIGGALCFFFDALLKFIGGMVKGNIAFVASLIKAMVGLIGKLSQGDFMGAVIAFFSGVNQAVFFLIGGSFADFIGVPFLIVDELNKADPRWMPSMERMGEELTRDNPFFLVNLVIGVLTVISTKGSPIAVGGLIIILSPIFGMLLTPPVRQALQAAKDPAWIAQFKTLSVVAVRSSIESMVKVTSGLVVGVLTVSDMTRKIQTQLTALSKKQGLGLTTKAITFFTQNMVVKLVNYTMYLYSSLTRPSGFNMKELSIKTLDLLSQFLVLIPIFAEQVGFDEEGLKAIKAATDVATATTAEAKTGIKALFEELEPKQQAEVVAELVVASGGSGGGGATVPSNGAAAKPSSAPVFIALSAAAGITLGFMLFGGRRGA